MSDLGNDPRLQKAVKGLRSLLDLTVRDIMQTDIITLEADDLLATAARVMIENKINGIVVMQGKKVYSVLSSWELLHSSYVESFSDKMDYLKTPLKDLIEEPDYASLPPSATLAQAVSIIARNNQRTVPIIDDGVLEGVISVMDVMKAYDKMILQ